MDSPQNSQSLTQQMSQKSSRIKSCNNCRRKKLRCDKKLPCSRCLIKKIDGMCKYESYIAEARSLRNTKPSIEEITYSSENNSQESLVSPNGQRSGQLSFHGVYSLMDEFMKDDSSSKYSFNFIFKPVRLPKDIEDFCKHIPPLEICLESCDFFFLTLGNLIDVISKSRIETTFYRFYQKRFEVNDLVLLLSMLSAAFRRCRLPANASRFCESVHLTHMQLAEEYYNKAEELISLNDFFRYPKSVETLQHLVFHAALEFTDARPELVFNLTRAVYYLNSMNVKGLLNETGREDLWKLILAVKKLDTLTSIFFNGIPFMQHDIADIQLSRLNNCFTESPYQKLLSAICEEGLKLCKNTACMSVEEYVLNMKEVEVKLSLLLMEIDLKVYSPLNPISKFQCFFLKSVLWTTKVTLYMPLLSMDHESIKEPTVLKEKLAETLLYYFRLILDSMEEISEVCLHYFYFVEALKNLTVLILCRNEKYSYKDELFDSFDLMKRLASEMNQNFFIKIIEEMMVFFRFVYQQDSNQVGNYEGMNDIDISSFCEFLMSSYCGNPGV